MTRLRPIRGRRGTRLRRQRFDLERGDRAPEPTPVEPSGALVPVAHPRVPSPVERGDVGVGWELSAASEPAGYRAPPGESSLDTQLLALLSDPRVDFLTVDSAAAALGRPAQDVATALESMRQAGILVASGGAVTRYGVTIDFKAELEAEFSLAAQELGEHGVLARLSDEENALTPFEDEEPRLPATAGLLSLFLPGTGQLLNGDIGRASLVFAVWSLAWITHLSPVWTFVCLYAGAEAFFTAKIRSMERKLREERQLAAGPDPKKLPSPRMT